MASDRVPPPIRKILDYDIKLTKGIVDYAYKNYPKLNEQSSRSLMKVLEISCHGVVWLALTLMSIYLSISTREIQVNLFLALIYDIIIVAVVKAITRRTRPTPDPSTIAKFTVDKFSFPSGHASRSILLLSFFYSVTNSSFLLLLLSLWSSVICASRVLMRRHHVLDVAAGVAIGVIEWMLVSFLWCGEERSNWLAGVFVSAEDEFDGS